MNIRLWAALVALALLGLAFGAYLVWLAGLPYLVAGP